MSTLAYFKSLLPSFTTRDLSDSLAADVKSLRENVLPAFEQAIDWFQDQPFRDESVKAINASFLQSMKANGIVHKKLRDPNMLEYVRETIVNVIAMEGWLKERIREDMSATVVTDALSYSNQYILQTLECISFYNRYCKVLINYITAKELEALDSSRQKGMPIPPPDTDLIQSKQGAFAVITAVLSLPLSQIQSDYQEVPEIDIDVDTFNEIRSVYKDKLDPQGYADLMWPLSAFYHFRLKLADWQMDNYLEGEQTLKAAEFRVMLMRRQISEGKGDAEVEKLLDTTEKHIVELRRKQEKLEKRYGLK